MDSTKLSLSSKALHVNSGGGNESLMEEAAVLKRNGVDWERQRDMEARETDVVDGMAAAAEINHHHRGSPDKHKFSSVGYQRRTKQKVVTDFGTKGPSAGAKPRAALRQVLFNQGVSEKNLASELDVLKQDLGSFAVPISLKWRWNEGSQGSVLEKNWTDIVHSHSTMSKMQRHQQEALWEFVHTELTYINKLIIIKDLVIAALVNLHQHGFLLEATPELLFSNLPSVLAAHQLFWQEVIYPMLQEVRRTGKPFDPMMLEAGCLQFPERFSAYKHYCWEEENNLEFTRRLTESNQQFFTYVQWVETHPQCGRMRLGDMQAKPHQRITKYPLLLKAVLKTTQDPLVQNALRGMLSSVNSFLESINDYLKLKDEELALAISSQRVEGYEVEGINEDVDRHVREICQFDLTCPIRGIGPGVVRKLLLEENLKIRGRKDSKLEVVALLFSDVLLVTKVQKKGERLKVVRPPLALDRTYCITLKDGCSFVLVEVGELHSAMNVYLFTAGTSESCSTWVSTIQQAKETLWSMRQAESNRQLEIWRIQQLEAKPVTEEMDGMAREEQQPLMQSRRENFVHGISEDLIIPRSVNGVLASRDVEEQHPPPGGVASNKPAVSFWHSQLNANNRKLAQRGHPGRQQSVKGFEWIEMRVRGDEVYNHTEEEERMNHGTQAVPNLDHFSHSVEADPSRHNTAGPRAFLYPDVDYPTDRDTPLHPAYRPAASRESLGKGGASTQRDSFSQPVNQNSWRHRDMETPPESWGYKNLKSPGLRRRRPISAFNHQDPSSQTAPQFMQGSGHTDSSSFLRSKSNLKRTSLPPDSHRVLKLGSLKQNQGMFWSMEERVSPDTQTLSESELPDINHCNGMKTKRSASIPNIVIEGYNGFRLQADSPEDASFPTARQNPNSPLEGLLERAKERHELKRDVRNVKMASLRARYPSSPSFSNTPSPSPSDGDRDTEWEEVELLRHRALSVSKGWKEQLVDGDEDDNSSSFLFPDGVNVDWSGWCFDDEEVMDHLYPAEEGFLEGISRSLASWDIHGLSEQEDGEYSQV